MRSNKLSVLMAWQRISCITLAFSLLSRLRDRQMLSLRLSQACTTGTGRRTFSSLRLDKDDNVHLRERLGNRLQQVSAQFSILLVEIVTESLNREAKKADQRMLLEATRIP